MLTGKWERSYLLPLTYYIILANEKINDKTINTYWRAYARKLVKNSCELQICRLIINNNTIFT